MIDKELDILKNKCLLFNQFMIEKGGFPLEMQSSFVESNKLINEAYTNGKIKVLRAMSKDIDEQVLKHMSLSMTLELKAYFGRLNIDFEAVDKARLKAIDKIVKKKKISGPGEYELIINRVDEIYDEPTRVEELNILNGLLLAFDANKNS